MRKSMKAIAFAFLAVAVALPLAPVLANQPSRMIMQKKTLEDGRGIILQGGKAYFIDRLGVKRQARLNGQYKAKDGSTITIQNGNVYVQPPGSRSLSEDAAAAGIRYPH